MHGAEYCPGCLLRRIVVLLLLLLLLLLLPRLDLSDHNANTVPKEAWFKNCSAEGHILETTEESTHITVRHPFHGGRACGRARV